MPRGIQASRNVSCFRNSLDDEEANVNSLAWNPFKPKEFISGAGYQVKLWDLSIQNSVKVFK